MRRLFDTASALGVGGLALLVAAVAFVPKPAASPRPPVKAVPVLAAKAEPQDVPIILRGLGTVTAFNSVALRSRVEGAITQVNFREGQVVRAGDLLIQLDPRPYQAALDQAQANLTRDQAALANAKVDLRVTPTSSSVTSRPSSNSRHKGRRSRRTRRRPRPTRR